MNLHERLMEGIRAVHLEAEGVIRSGPLVSPQQAYALGTLMKLQAATLLSAVNELSRETARPRAEAREVDLFRS